MVQRQTPKEIKAKQRLAKQPKTIQQYRAGRATGVPAIWRRVPEPSCFNIPCTYAYVQQPATEPVKFLGESWSAKHAWRYRWMFDRLESEWPFCEECHKHVMLMYLFRQLKLGAT